jgi:integrase
MARKTNFEVNGQKYYQLYPVIGKDASGKYIRKKFYGKTKTEAVAKRDAYFNGIKKGLNKDYNKVSVGELLHVWLYEVLRPSEMKPTTFDRYEGLYRNYIKNSWMNSTLLVELRSITVQRFYNEYYEEGKTPKTIGHIHKLLRYFFNYCITEDYLLKNPCFKLSIPGTISEKTTKDIEPYTNTEIAAIKRALRENGIEMPVLLCFATGMRQGEMLGLSFEDIDLDAGEIKIRKNLKNVKIIDKDGKYEYKRIFHVPKTKNSTRTVPVPSALIGPLKRHLDSQLEKMRVNCIPYTPDKLIFTTENGSSFDCKNLLRAWRRVQKKAGVKYRNYHTIRHTYATRMFENGIPLKIVSVLLGHANIKITADTYTHVMPQEKIKAADTLNHLFI